MHKTITIAALVLMTMMTACANNNSKAGYDLKVSSFNLRMDTSRDGKNSWAARKEMVKGLIRFHDLDIIGTQEGFRHQLEEILELNEYAYNDYAYVGGGRDDGKHKGEHSAIIYRRDRFDLLDNGDFWFSETPDVPGKGWDATCCNRICSWAKFEDKLSGKVFFVFNSHYDHQGKVARKNSSLLLLQKIEQIAGDKPVFATGDFNATPDDEPIRIIYDSGKFYDSYLVTQEPPYGTEGTYNAFKTDYPMRDRIDYIWITPGITVKKYGVLNDMPYGRFPSDHFPVVIQAYL